MRLNSLDDWLAYIEGLHPRGIDLGLERIRRVAMDMNFAGLSCPVVTVAGTNGKGSTVAMLEAVLAAAGHRVASYTSPHLLRYNERVRIAGREADDETLCAAFDRVDRARGPRTLTYFEFGTLGALDVFARAAPDVAVLEVGMGGRLDAVNIIDPDVAIITAIGLDHREWLGSDREAIGREKAGILRAGRPAVCSDPDPPQSLMDAARSLDAPLHRLGLDFRWVRGDSGDGLWSWQGPRRAYPALPRPALAGRFQLDNAAGVVMALELLSQRLDCSEAALRQGLASVSIPGRFQTIDGPVIRVLDVAHNADGARVLAETLADRPVAGATRAVVAILADKDIESMIAAMAEVVDDWRAAALPVARAAPAGRIMAALAGRPHRAPARTYDSVAAAYRAALADSSAGDRVVVFGSFYTVAEALRVERGDAVR